ncbi:MAG: ABC transporter permease [Synergistaceae bacterium]|nr:ABC transporter permease [Synergistaceae bacterium]
MSQRKFSFAADTWRRLKKNKLALVGLVILIALISCALFANVLAPYSYAKQELKNSFKAPSWSHPFGTDEYGRDILSRCIYGARISLVVGFIAVGISIVVGVVFGSIAGYFGHLTDNVIMRAMDVLMAIPQMLLAIAIAAALGPGLFNLMIAVGIANTPSYARLVRASVLSIKDHEFIEAARAIGTNDFMIIVKHVLPNCVAPIIVQATVGVALAILTAASLSFIGLGIQPPEPEWGSMLSSGRYYIRDNWNMTLFPGLAIAITIFSLNVLGDGLRDALDPKLRD